MIRLKVLFLFFLALQSAVGMAQTEVSFQVKGILLDSLTQEGEPYATIRIVRDDKPEKPVKMMVSDMKGRFRETVSGKGKFTLSVTSVGRTTIVRKFTVKESGEETAGKG